MHAFYSCASCASYVKERDPACPFCGTPRTPQSRTTPRRALPPGMSRGQWLVLGSALAVAGCESRATPTFECAPDSGFYCDRSTEYCAISGSSDAILGCVNVLPGDGGGCSRFDCASSGCPQRGQGQPICACVDDNDGGVVVKVFCSTPSPPSGSGCYGAPPARLERLAAA